MATRKEMIDLVEEICSPLFSTEWGKRLSMGTLALSTIFLCAIVVNIFTDWYSYLTNFRKAQPVTVSSENNLASLVSQIPNSHLFGQHGLQSARLPITSLRIELTGIIEAKPEGASRVIITEGGKPGKVYQVGDLLESGVRISAIANDGVVLENGGQLEKLPLRRKPLVFQREVKPK